MGYILGFSLPIQDTRGIETPADALLASSLIAVAPSVMCLLVVVVFQFISKRETKTWTPTLKGRRSATFLVFLLLTIAAKAVGPTDILPLFLAAGAIGLVAGKWKQGLPSA